MLSIKQQQEYKIYFNYKNGKIDAKELKLLGLLFSKQELCATIDDYVVKLLSNKSNFYKKLFLDNFCEIILRTIPTVDKEVVFYFFNKTQTVINNLPGNRKKFFILQNKNLTSNNLKEIYSENLNLKQATYFYQYLLLNQNLTFDLLENIFYDVVYNAMLDFGILNIICANNNIKDPILTYVIALIFNNNRYFYSIDILIQNNSIPLDILKKILNNEYGEINNELRNGLINIIAKRKELISFM